MTGPALALPRARNALDARRPVVVVVSGGVGDNLFALPAVRALSSLFPGRLTVVCLPGRGGLFSEPGLARVVEVGTPAGDDGAGGAEGRIRAADLVACLDLTPTPLHRTVMDGASPAWSVGFFRPLRTLVPLDDGAHMYDQFFAVPRMLRDSLRLADFAGRLDLAPGFWRTAAQLRRLVAPPPARVLVVHGDTKEEKTWARDRLVSLVRRFLDRHADHVALVVGGAGAALDEVQDRRVVSLCGLPLTVTVALVASADLFVGVDSSMLHAADLARVPAVGLFGPTNCARYGVRFARHRHVCGHDHADPGSIEYVFVVDRTGLPSRPRRLVWGKGSMDEVDEDEALKALEALVRHA